MSATQLLIRLSDEKHWASEPFSASSANDLRDGALEAFVALRAEWTATGRRSIPAHQAIKLASHEARRPRALCVQVCYHGEWSVVPPFTPVIYEPGAVPGVRRAWVDENWSDAWGRCIRTFEHVDKIGAFCNWTAKP